MTEPRERKCPCCTQLLTESEYIRAMSLLAAASATHALGYEWCRTCGGPVEKGREVYDRPTCYRCLPPPEPLSFIDGAPAAPAAPVVYATLQDRADWLQLVADDDRARHASPVRADEGLRYSRDLAPVADVVVALDRSEKPGLVVLRIDKVRAREPAEPPAPGPAASEAPVEPCPECNGATIEFRGSGLDLQRKVCSRWQEPGHLSWPEMERIHAEKVRAHSRGKVRFA